MLKQLHEGQVAVDTEQQLEMLQEGSVKLAVQCLGYDFIGTNHDESTEDSGTIQVPVSWRTYKRRGEKKNPYILSMSRVRCVCIATH